ncbi:hypothetical protein QR685DRAFT_306983 [Neurospora intermedia]|uniref:Uncharacterized protein n=1 Tax=Neurospora intermedia TaxID=5142 RepID=A0ABR3DBE1_NEUIN
MHSDHAGPFQEAFGNGSQRNQEKGEGDMQRPVWPRDDPPTACLAQCYKQALDFSLHRDCLRFVLFFHFTSPFLRRELIRVHPSPHSCPLPIHASDSANRILGTCLLPLSGQVQPTCRIPHPKTFPQKSVAPIDPSVPHLRLSPPHSPVSPSHPPPPYELASEGVRILSHCGRRHWYLKSL